MAQKQWREAAGLLEGLILDQPTAERYLKQGKAYRMLKEWDLAEAHLKTANEMKSKYAEAYFELGGRLRTVPMGPTPRPQQPGGLFSGARIRMDRVGYARSLGQWEPLFERYW